MGFAIEALVAVLLAVTIGYCVLVNRKLKDLRSDQSELKAIVRDLHAATGQAENAIAGLRESARTADETLGHQLERVRSLDEQLRTNIARGESLLGKLTSVNRAQHVERERASAPEAPTRRLQQKKIGLGLLNEQRKEQTRQAQNDLENDGVAA